MCIQFALFSCTSLRERSNQSLHCITIFGDNKANLLPRLKNCAERALESYLLMACLAPHKVRIRHCYMEERVFLACGQISVGCLAVRRRRGLFPCFTPCECPYAERSIPTDTTSALQHSSTEAAPSHPLSSTSSCMEDTS